MGGSFEEVEIPVGMADLARRIPRDASGERRRADDAIMEKYLEGIEPAPEEIKKGIREVTLRSKLFPVLCGSALRNKGVQPVLDAIVDYLPSPRDIKPVEGHNPED